jgi:hypothetical protein
MSTIVPTPLIEQLRSALPAGAENLADQVAARLERLERTLRTFAEQGATHGWIPDDAHRWHAGDWFEYLHRLDRTVRQRAAAALD